jgi:hypothetical protein
VGCVGGAPAGAAVTQPLGSGAKPPGAGAGVAATHAFGSATKAEAPHAGAGGAARPPTNAGAAGAGAVAADAKMDGLEDTSFRYEYLSLGSGGTSRAGSPTPQPDAHTHAQ